MCIFVEMLSLYTLQRTECLLQLKLEWAGDIRRILRPSSFHDLKVAVEKTYKLDPVFILKYKDEDGDMITISYQADFDKAERLSKVFVYEGTPHPAFCLFHKCVYCIYVWRDTYEK